MLCEEQTLVRTSPSKEMRKWSRQETIRSRVGERSWELRYVLKYKEFTEFRFGIRMKRNQAHLLGSFRPEQLSIWYTQPKTDWEWQWLRDGR